MKQKILALGLCLSFLLTGCEAMLNGEYLSVKPHSVLTAAEDDSSVIRVENYQELVSGILKLVSSRQEQGVIQLGNYNTRDVEADLSAACLEVSHEDPLGAYAVDYIKHEFSRILTYYQATITIGYRRTLEQMKSIVPVTGSSAIRSEVGSALAGFSPEAVLRVTYFNEDEHYIRALALQAYYDTPAAAFGMPEITVSVYPDTGYQRIVEITFTYAEPLESLHEKSQQLQTAARSLSQSAINRNFRGRLLLSALYGSLLDYRAAAEEELPEGEAAPARSSLPYAALVEGDPDSQALALAFKLMCNTAQAECTVVQGTLDGLPHFWNIVTVGSDHRHIDATLGRDGFYLTDADLRGLSGAEWSGKDYPVCGDPAAAVSGGEIKINP